MGYGNEHEGGCGKMKHKKFMQEFKKERKEHPTLPKNYISVIVLDHMKGMKKKKGY